MQSIVPESIRAGWFKRLGSGMGPAWLVAVVLILAPGAGPWAGNEKIIVDRTREMEELNKQAVEQVPDIPADGTVHIKADGVVRDGEIQFTIREHSTTTTTVKEGEILDHESKTETPKNDIIHFQEKHNQTTQTEGRDGENDPVED